jgi:hypothetical protein
MVRKEGFLIMAAHQKLTDVDPTTPSVTDKGSLGELAGCSFLNGRIDWSRLLLLKCQFSRFTRTKRDRPMIAIDSTIDAKLLQAIPNSNPCSMYNRVHSNAL